MCRLGSERGTVSVVTDQVLSPTYTVDLARMIWRLVDVEAQGLFHVTNSGSCSWYDFARMIFDLSGLQVDVQPITTASTGAAVRRPRFSVLANQHLANKGYGAMRPWTEALEDYLHATGGWQGYRAAAVVEGVNSAKS
jgi:dTDP-4-dehydrorhamnose reductase